jgi:hypothetical protein
MITKNNTYESLTNCYYYKNTFQRQEVFLEAGQYTAVTIVASKMSRLWKYICRGSCSFQPSPQNAPIFRDGSISSRL